MIAARTIIARRRVRLITGGVMSGTSSGQLTPDTFDNSACLRLCGNIRMENSSSFVHAVLDVKDATALDASGYQGVLLKVYGNDEGYNLHLRTDDAWLPWQFYRTSFQAPASWHTVLLPFTAIFNAKGPGPFKTFTPLNSVSTSKWLYS
jgi:hypothetical protein